MFELQVQDFNIVKFDTYLPYYAIHKSKLPTKFLVGLEKSRFLCFNSSRYVLVI